MIHRDPLRKDIAEALGIPEWQRKQHNRIVELASRRQPGVARGTTLTPDENRKLQEALAPKYFGKATHGNKKAHK